MAPMSYFAPNFGHLHQSSDPLSRQARCDLPATLAITEAEIDLLAAWLLDDVEMICSGREVGIARNDEKDKK